MRLICPNCDAQYEVGAGVIPLSGRDVQCSNCGQTWFQTHPDMLADEEDDDTDGFDPVEPPYDDREPPVLPHMPPEIPAEAVVAASDGGDLEKAQTDADGAGGAEDPMLPDVLAADLPDADLPAAGVGTTAEAQAQPDDGLIGEPPMIPTEVEDDDVGWGGPAIAAATVGSAGLADPSRRPLDEAVMSVLREEAERELSARRSSPDVDPAPVAPDPLPRSRPAAREMTRRPVTDLAGDMISDAQPAIGGIAAGDGAAREVAASGSGGGGATAGLAPRDQSRSSRRDLLPDIEWINSTLQSAPSGSTSAYTPNTPAELDIVIRPKRTGFRGGFTTVLIFGAVLAGIYIMAPTIAEKVPALDPSLKTYVALVDAGRLWVNDLMQRSLDGLQEKPAG